MLRVITLLILISGCATSPDAIQAQYVSGFNYSNYYCDTLRNEALKKSDRIQELYKLLSERYDNDVGNATVGTLLWWPSLVNIEGDGPEALEFSKIKGEYAAMKQVLDSNNCKKRVMQVNSETITTEIKEKIEKNPRADKIGKEIIQS